jgi:predicted P-loop ATPase
MPGRKAAAQITEKLLSLGCTVSIIDTSSLDLPDGYDAADFTGSRTELVAWMVPLIKKISLPAEPEPEPPMPEPVERITPAPPPEPKMKGLSIGGNGNPQSNLFNAMMILKQVPDISQHIWADDFHLEFFTTIASRGTAKSTEPQKIGEGFIDDVRIMLQGKHEMHKISRADTEAAIKAVARRNVRNEPLEWLETLKWDQTPRLDEWLINYAGAEDSAYTRAISKNFLLAMCQRVKRPGSKFDHVLVLEGCQGLGKSQLLQGLCGKYHTEYTASIKRNGKDANLAFKSNMLVEFSEGAALAGMTNEDKKAFISANEDAYRVPYDRSSDKWPRTFVFAITTNNQDFLDDGTGDRRYWPIHVSKIDWEGIKLVREQLFAEAFYRLNLEENYFAVPWEEAEQAREVYTVNEELDDVVADYCNSRTDGFVRLSDVWTKAIEGSLDRFDRRSQLNLGRIMRRIGWKKTVKNGHKVWMPAIDPVLMAATQKKRSPVKNYAPQGFD